MSLTNANSQLVTFEQFSHLNRVLPQLAPVNLVWDNATAGPHCKAPLMGGSWLGPQKKSPQRVVPQQGHAGIPGNQCKIQQAEGRVSATSPGGALCTRITPLKPPSKIQQQRALMWLQQQQEKS